MTAAVMDDGLALLRSLVLRAREHSAQAVSGLDGLRAWAQRLERLPEFGRAADAVARAKGDLLDGNVLMSTGVASLLASGEDVDENEVAAPLWHYATRTTTAHWEAVALNVRELPGDMVVGGWHTWNPDDADLAAFAPVPAAATHLRHDPWPVDAVTQRALLRRHAGDRARRRLHLMFRGRRFELAAVWPLAILNL